MRIEEEERLRMIAEREEEERLAAEAVVRRI